MSINLTYLEEKMKKSGEIISQTACCKHPSQFSQTIKKHQWIFTHKKLQYTRKLRMTFVWIRNNVVIMYELVKQDRYLSMMQ